MPIFRTTILFLCVLQLIVAVAAHAESEKIFEVRVKGNHRIESAAIFNVIAIKAGDILSVDKTDADIRAIYRLGFFQDIQVSLEESDKGAVLVYTVLEKPIVRDIKFEGNKEIASDKLKEALELKVNTVFSSKDLAKSVAKVKKLYGDDGYYLAEIEPEVEKRTPTELAVTFRITEGNKVLIRTIHFDGNHAFTDRQLRKVMETSEKWFLSWLTGGGTYKEDVLKNDALLIADHYLNNGYINVKVGEPVVKLTDAKDALEVFIGITEGEQYQVGNIDFKGDLLETVSELRKKVTLVSGQTFSRSTLHDDIAALTDCYADKGYAFANINPLTKVDTAKRIVDLTFDMEKGEMVSIERINISGNPKTRDKVVRRELRLVEGELSSGTGLKRSKQNLMNTGYFEEANLATAKGSAGNKLNINVDVKEKPTGSFSIGGGYSSMDGIIGQGSVQQSNFLGLGLKATLSASLGSRMQTYSLGVSDPYFLDTKWTFGGDIYRTQRIYNDYSRRLTGADIKGGYPINDNISTFLLYKFEVKDLYNPAPAYNEYNIDDPQSFPLGETTTSSVMASISHNNTDYRLDPSTGFINTFSAEFAGLGGNNKFARYTLGNSWFHPLYKKVIFSTKLFLGYLQEVEGQRAPIDERLYLGGIDSLCGYKPLSVSPVNHLGLANVVNGSLSDQVVYLGGNKDFYGNAEVSFPVIPDAGVKLVLFFDYGNSSSDSYAKMFSTTLMSYGGGIRWASPLGPLRLEYGVPINPRPNIDSAGGRFEFSIGSLF